MKTHDYEYILYRKTLDQQENILLSRLPPIFRQETHVLPLPKTEEHCQILQELRFSHMYQYIPTDYPLLLLHILQKMGPLFEIRPEMQFAP